METLTLFVVENVSTDQNLIVDTNIPYSKSIRHSRSSWSTHDCIPCYHRQLIFMVESIDSHNSSYNSVYDVNFRYDSQTTNPRPYINTNLEDLHTPRLLDKITIT